MNKLKRWWSRRSTTLKVIVFTFLFIAVGGRMIAPSLIKANVLKKLNAIPNYSATMEDVDISIFSPSITFKDIRIFSESTGSDNPLFKADIIKGELMMCSVNEGQMLTHTTVVNPTILFAQQTIERDTLPDTLVTNHYNVDSVNWREEIRKMFALKINKFDVHNGAIKFVNHKDNLKIDLVLDSIDANFGNLVNSEHLEDSLFGYGNMTARVMEHAPMAIDIKIDPLSEKGSFTLDFDIQNVDITSLNPFLREYANLDAEQGNFSLTSNVVMANGIMEGEVHPESHDFKIFDLKMDQNRGLKNMAWQGLVGSATKLLLLTQRNKDKVCKIEFTGTPKHLTIYLKKNSEGILSKIFVNEVNKHMNQHELVFVKLD